MAFRLAELVVDLSAPDAKLRGQLNTVQARLKRVQASMQNVSRHARRMLLVGGAAIVGFLKLQADQQKAEMMLDAALRATGQSVDALGAKLRRAAAAMQKQTVYGDEFTMGLMAQAINLGATGDQIEQYTKEALGLATALKMDLGTALRYTVLAHQGEFTMLRRYIPALRDTTDATEQMAIVTRMATAGFEQAQAETKTFAGQLMQLKNRLGDTGEKIGAIFLPAVSKLVSKIGPLAEDVAKWVSENGRLVLSLTAVTAGVLALAAILPTLTAGFAILIAHPLAIALTAAAAAVGIMILRIESLNAALQRTRDIDPRMTLKGLEGRLALLQGQAKATTKEITQLNAVSRAAQVREAAMGMLAGGPPIAGIRLTAAVAARVSRLRSLERESEGIRKDIVATQKLIEARRAEAKAIGEQDKQQKKLISAEAMKAWLAMQDKIKESRISQHALALKQLRDEMKATVDAARKAGVWEQRKLDIIEYFHERRDALDEDFARRRRARRKLEIALEEQRKAELEAVADVRARERLGVAGIAGAAFTGIAEMSRRIQEAIYQKQQTDKRDRLLKQIIAEEKKALEEQKLTTGAIKELSLLRIGQ